MACGDKKQKNKGKRVIPVAAIEVARDDIPVTLAAIGNVTPLASVEIKSRVGGIIEEQLVRNGQDVQRGDLLFRIDPRPFKLAVKEAQARLDRDRAHQKNAQGDLRRYSKLREMNVVAQEQFEDTLAEATSLENTIRLDEAAVEKAKLDLEYAAITAPISGRVGIVRVNVGNVIKANDDRTLCVINQIRPINISFTLPERYLGEILERHSTAPLRVSVSPSGANSDPVMADLSAVDNSVDTSTGTIRLLASYPNEESLFWPGQFARVELRLRTIADALLLPSGAVLQGMEGPYVYVVVPSQKEPDVMVVQPRRVTTEHIAGERTVIASGLEVGERVVLAGQINLGPGTRVTLKGKPDAGEGKAQ